MTVRTNFSPKRAKMAAVRLDELMAEIDRLLDAHEAQQADDPGEGNFRCENCVACYSCRFCVECDSCEDCTYCEESVDCARCTHCKRCVSCDGCTYTEDSRDCEGGRYLTLCVGCKNCVHCLGCVGLSDAEFYVLNEKRSRKEYFQILRAVQAELTTRLGDGWRPPSIGLVGAEDEDQPESAPASIWTTSGAEITHTQDLDHLAAVSSGHGGEEGSGWAWTDPPAREHTGVEELPPPPPYDTDAGIAPREFGSSPWIDEPQRESTWHGEDAPRSGGRDRGLERDLARSAKRSAAWLDPLATGDDDDRGDGPGVAERSARGGLSRSSRPARPANPERAARSERSNGSGSGSASGSGSGSGRRRDEESSMVRPKKPNRDEASGTGSRRGVGRGHDHESSGSERDAGRTPPASGGLRRGRPPARGRPPNEDPP